MPQMEMRVLGSAHSGGEGAEADVQGQGRSGLADTTVTPKGTLGCVPGTKKQLMSAAEASRRPS